jgi:hypothetical protein
MRFRTATDRTLELARSMTGTIRQDDPSRRFLGLPFCLRLKTRSAAEDRAVLAKLVRRKGVPSRARSGSGADSACGPQLRIILWDPKGDLDYVLDRIRELAVAQGKRLSTQS